jgi:hypothetical protein
LAEISLLFAERFHILKIVLVVNTFDRDFINSTPIVPRDGGIEDGIIV